MSNQNSFASNPARQFATDIVRRLVLAGHVAYFAGGCVRDQLLGIEPHDYDVATSATPMQVRELFGPRRTLLVGAAFGVVCVHQTIDNVHLNVEVATFRSDGCYSDGRHPDSVQYTTPEKDAERRDFTINGLFYDPIEERVIDYVGGVDDLNKRILRAIGNPIDRFGEDKLRLLRAIRFAARFDLEIDSATGVAIRGCASTLIAVSPERIAMEMRKLLLLPKRKWGMEQLFRDDLLAVVYPELDWAWRLSEREREHGLALLEQVTNADFEVAISAVLIPSKGELRRRIDENGESRRNRQETEGSRIAASLKHRWRLSNQEEESIRYYLDSVDSLLRSENAPWSSIQPWLADPRATMTLKLLEAWANQYGTPLPRRSLLQ